jgi:integrase
MQLRDDRLVNAFAEGKSGILDELVFPSETGTPIEMNNFSERVFKPLLTRAGLRRIRFHDLRHRADFPVMPTFHADAAREALAIC